MDWMMTFGGPVADLEGVPRVSWSSPFGFICYRKFIEVY